MFASRIPNAVLWEDAGITKLDLARYYEAIAPRFLAQAGHRPISLLRCPDVELDFMNPIIAAWRCWDVKSCTVPLLMTARRR